CWSALLGYPCCKESHKDLYKDKDGLWAIENGNWCEVCQKKTSQTCWSALLGYSCCNNPTKLYKDESGIWSVENDSWCGV
ncbi:Non-catalytic module family DOC2, partial [Piromyces sp. E2]